MSRLALFGAGLFSLLCMPALSQAAATSNAPTTTQQPTNPAPANPNPAPATEPSTIAPETNSVAAPATPAEPASQAPSETPNTQPTAPTNTSEPTNATAPTSVSTATTIDCNYHTPAEMKALDTTLIMQWAEKAAQQTFAFDPSALDVQLNGLKACYTEQGWQSFNDALVKSGNLNAIKTENLTVSSVIDGQSSISSVKENQWKVAIPLQVVYQNGKEKVLQPLTINLVVGRKVTGDLGIMQIIAMPRQAANAAPATPAVSGAATTANPATSSGATPAPAATPATATPAAPSNP